MSAAMASRSAGMSASVTSRMISEVGQRRPPVAPLDLLAGVAVHPLAGAKDHKVAHATADPLAARARVHGDGAADRARDAHARLQPREARPERSLTTRESVAPAPAVIVRSSAETFTRASPLQRDDAAVVARVVGQDVGALAQDDPAHALLGEHLHRPRERRVVAHAHRERRRPADPIARATREGLVAGDGRIDGAREAHVGVEDAHAWPPSPSRSRGPHGLDEGRADGGHVAGALGDQQVPGAHEVAGGSRRGACGWARRPRR